MKATGTPSSEDVEDDGRFLIELALVDAANPDAGIAFARGDNALNQRREGLRYVKIVGI